MKVKSTVLKFFLLLIISLSAVPVMSAETERIVVTIKPLHALVSGVIGNTGKATLLLTGNTSPHDFQLKPSQSKFMHNANIIFYIDNGFETFLSRTFETLPKKVRKVSIVQKIDLTALPYRKDGAWSTKSAEAVHQHDHGEHNLHVWLDPENAVKIVKAITKELSVFYPENRNTYKANARHLVKKLKELDTELQTTLSGVKDKPFIVFHDAYPYFERAYGLTAVGSITVEPDELPSPNRISEVRQKLQQTGAQCVFREPQFSDRLVKTITEDTDAKSGILDPLGAELAEGEALYFSLMRNLAQQLKQCLS